MFGRFFVALPCFMPRGARAFVFAGSSVVCGSRALRYPGPELTFVPPEPPSRRAARAARTVRAAAARPVAAAGAARASNVVAFAGARGGAARRRAGTPGTERRRGVRREAGRNRAGSRAGSRAGTRRETRVVEARAVRRVRHRVRRHRRREHRRHVPPGTCACPHGAGYANGWHANGPRRSALLGTPAAARRRASSGSARRRAGNRGLAHGPVGAQDEPGRRVNAARGRAARHRSQSVRAEPPAPLRRVAVAPAPPAGTEPGAFSETRALFPRSRDRVVLVLGVRLRPSCRDLRVGRAPPPAASAAAAERVPERRVARRFLSPRRRRTSRSSFVARSSSSSSSAPSASSASSASSRRRRPSSTATSPHSTSSPSSSPSPAASASFSCDCPSLSNCERRAISDVKSSGSGRWRRWLYVVAIAVRRAPPQCLRPFPRVALVQEPQFPALRLQQHRGPSPRTSPNDRVGRVFPNSTTRHELLVRYS